MSYQISRQTKLLIMGSGYSIYFLVEISVGYASHCLSLVSDSFHMFSDVLSILIAWYAIRLASRPVSSILNNGMTYGWQRAETVGALINGVFLLSLTFFIIMECIQRFVNPVEMKNPLMVICVAGFGLLLNIGGLLLFKEHAHHHHGHGHDHHGHSRHNELQEEVATELPQIKTDEEAAINISVADTSGLGDVYYSFQEKDDQPRSAPVLPPSSALRHPSHQSTNTGGHHLNMHGVFLHILADALGTIAVLISAIINYAFPRSGKAGGGEGWYGSNLMSPQPPFWLPPPPPPPPPPLQFPFSPPPPYFNNIQQQSEHSKNDWVVYIDPIASLIIAFLLINATFRLVKDSIYLLCQQAPRNLNINKIKEHILKDVDVENIHEFHVWTLNDSKIVASLHVVLLCPAAASTSSSSRLADPSRSRRVTDRLTRILHKHGIHNTTIQIEHMDGKSEENQKHVQEKIDHESSTCLIKCDSYAECIESSCCSYE